MKADMVRATEAQDRGESIGLMEPLLVHESSKHRAGLTDLAVELAARAAAFRSGLPQGTLAALAHLVRTMNCYYSNLIEGHHTHPVDIERAMDGDYSADPEQRNLQHEARAHVAVQQWIDDGGLDAKTAVTCDGVCEIHRRFCQHLPDELVWAGDPETGERTRVVPGGFRQRDVKVGRHVPVSPGAVPRFMARFEQVYGRLGKTDAILAVAAAHHRLVWIHPFLDGNGRVVRLMSHAMLRDTLDTGGVWSVARGLARSVADYKALLAAADQARRNDLDGRGHLSEEALARFTAFFLTTCLDQVDFMAGLMRPDRLRSRILTWTQEEVRAGALPPKSGQLLEAVLYRGTLPRGDVGPLLGVGSRQARRISSALIDRGVLVSRSPRAPLSLAFTARHAERWMPGLFPEKSG